MRNLLLLRCYRRKETCSSCRCFRPDRLRFHRRSQMNWCEPTVVLKKQNKAKSNYRTLLQCIDFRKLQGNNIDQKPSPFFGEFNLFNDITSSSPQKRTIFDAGNKAIPHRKRNPIFLRNKSV